jgi:hypothetical protein
MVHIAVTCILYIWSPGAGSDLDTIAGPDRNHHCYTPDATQSIDRRFTTGARTHARMGRRVGHRPSDEGEEAPSVYS